MNALVLKFNSRQCDSSGNQNIKFVAIILGRLPVFSLYSVDVGLDELLPMELVRNVHDFAFALNNLWMVLVARAKF
ncbi:hypothetical protein [Synechococcus sp. BIOS-E4-1]|uniref:hypothetical protein n=1 Tax=Synechococcus sp. BIOS-E4-1 TaxID=1400864 RepID=UPI0016475821|nr:hypothetical protein [Synechococcus sp. BIOS-E4-1]